ncbi:proline-rich protein 3 [Eutrema salsugineum]|uniref:proline-rich protein 3 n=1 Tax=Eutrema salsugineum TaxID=72664 RepID=UPI000CED7028|nr:proline-rich protein 3 [Eutrema salsugineum]
MASQSRLQLGIELKAQEKQFALQWRSHAPPWPFAPKPTYTPPTKPYVPEILKAVDGIILCKNGYETYPIQGAKAKIVCSEPGSYGKSNKEVVIYSDPTDSKGYFHVALIHITDLFHCRVKLYTSPVETCKNPTNVNKGLTGVPLSMYGYRYYSDKNLKLFSVGPFYFTGPKAAPTTPKY